ncbi:DUF397 domain-containing protein [Pseudonocardia alni]|uniref:DUF397 domain-containing protein n=1 Tax=Pseudonocardia alni subsp. carboxydivorans TaxID=415010 RepID=A0ABU9ACD5_PSEA5
MVAVGASVHTLGGNATARGVRGLVRRYGSPVQRSGVRGFVVSDLCHAGGCVGVAVADEGVMVRSTAVEDGPVAVFTREEWDVFLAGVRQGEFDYDDLTRLTSSC